MRQLIMRLMSLCLMVVVFIGAIYVDVAEAKTYTNRNDVWGRYYTSRIDLAAKLDEIFDGNASVYSSSNYSSSSLVNACLGQKAVPPGRYLYAGAKNYSKNNSGESCWIYANGVYYTLFGETTGNGSVGSNSKKLSVGGNQQFTYSNFQSWGVRDEPGALVRVDGHSLIVLKYDSSKIYYLDGNGDNQGVIAVREYEWGKCPWYGQTVSYIIQPKASYYDNIYPAFSQAEPITGYLAECEEYHSVGWVTMTKDAAIWSLPCSNKTSKSSTQVGTGWTGEGFEALRLFRNTAGNWWYQIDYYGQTAYVYGGNCSHWADGNYHGFFYTPDGKTWQFVD